MLELNKVLLIGNLTRDPELSYVSSGQALAKMGLAVSRRFKDRNNEWKDDTAFVDIEAWGKTGEFCSQYLKKGRRVFVEGRLQFDRWEANDGTKRNKLSVVAERIQFADPKPSETGAPGVDDTGDPGNDYQQAPPAAPQRPAAAPLRPAAATPVDFPEADATADDLPF